VSDTQQLYQLQKLDSQVDELRRRLVEIEASLVETEELRQARNVFEVAEAKYHKLKTAMTDLDLEIKGIQQKIEDHETRLYSGRVSAKEASSLQDDVTATKRWLAKREDDLLNLMIELEEAEEVFEARHQFLKQTQQQWEEDQASLIQERAESQDKLKQALETRPALIQFIDPDDIDTYERLRQKFGGIGVVFVDGDICTTCGFTLPSYLIQQALNNDELYFCEGCGRIMHVF